MTLLQPAAVMRRRYVPNAWDLVAVPLILGVFVVLAHGARETAAPLAVLQTLPVTLNRHLLPEYAVRTALRMLAALLLSLLFTFTVGTLAARSRRAELLLIPLLDILQSVPVLGFISVTVTWFLHLFPGRVLGAEGAAIFAIFTSQAWNMALSFYQSLRTVPGDLQEACQSLRLTAWQRFCRLDVPFALPSLIWNMMMSMSGGWFFVVASEAIAVGNQQYTLPGIGSYVALAIDRRDLHAVVWAIMTMLGVIVIYDQLMFRPLVAWADKFRVELTAGRPHPTPWVLQLIRRTRLLAAAVAPVKRFTHWLPTLRLQWRMPRRLPVPRLAARSGDRLWFACIALTSVYASWHILQFIAIELSLRDLLQATALAGLTLVRVVTLIVLASLIWVPIGIWIGVRWRLAASVQPLAQFLAAFPANLLFPIAVVSIVHYHLHPDIWLSPLMIFGTQWYILFNVIAGASAFPNDLREAATLFRIRGWPRWRSVMLPGIFPYFVTGALTASGGCWNASIVAEAVSWGDTHLRAHGIGAYIADATAAGDYPRIVLGIAVMSIFVVVFNRLVWRRLYDHAEQRMRLA